MINSRYDNLRIGLFSFLMCVLTSAVFAKDAPITISPRLFNQLSKAEDLIGKQDYSKARQTLDKILADVEKNSYAQAITLRRLASVFAIENQYPDAAKYLAQAIATQALTETQQQQTRYNLGQLYMASNQYQRAINILEPWLINYPDGQTVKVRILLANAYSQLNQYTKALVYIEHVIKHAKKPKENWLQLNLALYYQLENYQAAAIILRRLVGSYSDNKNYWQQLATIYQQIHQYSAALSVTHLAYEKGLINTETEILQLFNLLMFNKQPYQAASLLALELDKQAVTQSAKNWELLANAWTLARDYKSAVLALEKASALHDKGELYLQLGRIHVQQELWQAAINALNKALKKGRLKQTGEAYILLGLSYYESGKLKSAQSAFSHAMQYSKTKKSAQQWLDYAAANG